MPVTEAVRLFLQRYPDVNAAASLAVAVSGGADSLALCHALAALHPAVHAIVINHGLRPESGDEAAAVVATIATHTKALPVLKQWQGDKPVSRIQENARAARYALLAEACAERDVSFLFLGHHRDDQAETFLMRLAAGSGLDGLAAMRERSDHEAVTYLRPLLDLSHDDLVAYCQAHGLPFIDDPSNANPAFERVRLRQSRAVLAQEGLTSQRLTVTAKRLRRAADALNALTLTLWQDHGLTDGTMYALPLGLLLDLPEDIAIRLVLHAGALAAPSRAYPLKLEVVERLLPELLFSTGKTSRTVGGLLLVAVPKLDRLEIRPEKLS